MKDLLTFAGALGIGYALLKAIDGTQERHEPLPVAQPPVAPATPATFLALPPHPGHQRFGLN